MGSPSSGPDSARPGRFLFSPGPLAYLGGLFLSCLLTFGLARGVLALFFLERVRAEPHLWWVFPLGLRIDVLVASYALALPTLALTLLPARVLRRAADTFALYASAVLTLIVLMEAVSLDYLRQFDVRPDLLFLEHFGDHEVLGTIWAEYHWHLVGVAVLAASMAWVTFRPGRRLFLRAESWGSARRALALPVLAAALFLGARGTLQHRSLNAASVAFSGHSLVNQLALNSSYSAARAWYDRKNERSPAALYGHMSEAEILERVGRYTTIPGTERSAGELPFVHVQRPRQTLERPRNLVIVLEESLGAEFVGALGGKPLTPNLDSLAREGLWFTRLFCTGTRTVRGIEAVVSGFLPTPGSSVVRLNKSQSNFFTIAALLKQHGYATDFVYGGESHFDNMAEFFLANGFDRALNEGDYESPVFHGTWGVSDEDLMRKADEVFRSHGAQPFFALVLSTSNHSPYEFPDGRIQLCGPEKATRDNTVKYADYALGELFRLAKQQDYYDDTVWVVVADHDERTYGDGLIPVDKFHIPGLLIGPGVPASTFDRVASQIDLVPTALDVLGIEARHPMIGRNLFQISDDDPGRAILQFNDIHGFLVGNRLAVFPGGAEPRCFELLDWRLVPCASDPELLRDGLAHALFPWLLYDQRRYRLPSQVTPAGSS